MQRQDSIIQRVSNKEIIIRLNKIKIFENYLVNTTNNQIGDITIIISIKTAIFIHFW